MKIKSAITILVLLLTPKIADAGDLIFRVGTLATYHFDLTKPMKKLLDTRSGLIINGLRFEVQNENHNYIFGQDCMGQPLTGYYYNIYNFETWNLSNSFIGGSYITPLSKWRRWNLPRTTYNVTDADIKVWPILGIKTEKEFYKTQNYRFKTEALFTPAMISFGVSVEF